MEKFLSLLEGSLYYRWDNYVSTFMRQRPLTICSFKENIQSIYTLRLFLLGKKLHKILQF